MSFKAKQEYYVVLLYIIIVYGGENGKNNADIVKIANLYTGCAPVFLSGAQCFVVITVKITKLAISKLPQFTIL